MPVPPRRQTLLTRVDREPADQIGARSGPWERPNGARRDVRGRAKRSGKCRGGPRVSVRGRADRWGGGRSGARGKPGKAEEGGDAERMGSPLLERSRELGEDRRQRRQAPPIGTRRRPTYPRGLQAVAPQGRSRKARRPRRTSCVPQAAFTRGLLSQLGSRTLCRSEGGPPWPAVLCTPWKCR
jgi:hypothetical protein